MTMWCCWGTLPSLVHWGCPHYLNKLFFFFCFGMDPFAEDFDALFSCMSGSSSSTLGTSAKGDRPPIVLDTKGKLPVSFLGGSRGTSATHKRKFGPLFMVIGDLIEGELDPVANKQICHLADCFLHSSECISPDMAIEADRFDLNEHYSRALKAAFYLSHGFHDFSGVSAAQTEVERLRCEVRLGQSREEKLGEEVRALQRRLDDHARENSRMSKKLEEVESKHGELLSRQ
ncbi:uncharacterized protein LOC127903775 isoform X3 [Citrus sinensis]|uniref:uncharacterized protein LOC127903775 isoform X3 n=1 Tax=Citrus sinensis TaxID=2711 RepID=UPI0022783E67|nr:uncharacterized protein LOC127903775 isoform X3 [Citrus sinensis]